MRQFRVAEDILPLSELEGHAAEVVEGLRARGRPMVITKGGKAAAVLISPEEFDRLIHEAHVVSAIEQGLADADLSNAAFPWLTGKPIPLDAL